MPKGRSAVVSICTLFTIVLAAAVWEDANTTVSSPGKAQQSAMFQNPVFGPSFADPSILKGKDGRYYAYSSEDDWGDGKGSRLIPIIRSSDLVHWTYVGDAFPAKPTWHKGPGVSLWAPDISFYNNKYYLYYSMAFWGDTNEGIGVATADSPAGPFQDHGKMFTSDEIGHAGTIDPMHVVDDDGKHYLFWGSFSGIFGAELSPDGYSLQGDPFTIATNFEGSYIIKRNGYYYYFGSQGSCCEGAASSYHVMVARSRTIKGPYVDKDGASIRTSDGSLVLTGNMEGQDVRDFIVGPGHISIVTDDAGQDWLVYHGIERDRPLLPGGATRRPLFLDPIVWQDGWPVVKEVTPNTKPQPVPRVKP